MVTNTAGTTNTETPTAKENGECEKNNAVNEEYSSLKQNSNESSKVAQADQVVTRPQNDTSTAMSNSQNQTNEGTSFSQPSSSNGISGNPNYSNRPYGNGLPPSTSVTMNGPPQGLSNASHPNYGSYNHNPGVSPKPGPRPMQGAPPGPGYPPSMQHRYPSNQQPGATPTLNQLLTTPSRYPGAGQYSSYSNHPTSQQPDFAQAQSQNWQSKPQQYGRGPPEQQGKPDTAGYPPPPQQQQYPSQHPSYPPNHSRYPTPAPNAGQVPYNQTPQYNSGMPPPGSAGYPTAAPSPSRHPSYSGYPSYNHVQQPPYYATRPGQPQGYPPPSSSQLPTAEGRSFGQQDPQQNVPPALGQDPMQHQQPKDMMSPTRTPQPGSNPGSVQSPMNATPPSHVHPGYPSVAQLRGQSPAPASPASVGPSRGTPLSPPSVRPGTPLQQAPMRSASEHSDHSSVPGQSPVPGPNYGNYRFHSSQTSFGNQPPVYPPHMMSPQHQPAYPPNQQHPPPQHQGPPSMRQPGPPSAGKPTPPMQGSVSQSFSQSQALPAYQQPGGHMQYYDNMPQQRPVMQGYSSSSPAPPPPTERRPSRQGSQPSAAQLPEQSGRQGAAAAAAAAMAAAAHSAQPGSAPGQRTQTPNYYPQQVQQQPQPPPQQQQPRPQHPGYNSMHQGNEMYQQNVGYPRMPHPGAPGSGPPHRVMGPPGMSGPHPQSMHRMHPPNQYPSGYPQSSGPPPQGHYPGYYPPSAADPNQPPGVRPGYDQPPPPQEEATKKPAARSASQKLAALFEPADEPGRRDFIERVLRYWEDKDLPLKNAPLMGRKTLDLYRLFQTVKENGGMQEVTSGKKWIDISSGMGLGTASTSGFTLKKQYCKYLYGFECRERGEVEPQEALARVTEANRKRKQAQDGAKDDAKVGGIPPQTPPSMHPLHGPSIPSQSYPPQQYPYTGQYPHPMSQQYRQPSPAGTPNYMMNAMSAPPHPHMGSFPQHPGHNSGTSSQPAPQPVPNFPTGPEPSNMYPGPRMSSSSTPSSGFSTQPIPTPTHLPSSTASEQPTAFTKVDDTHPKSEVKEKPSDQIQPDVSAASETDAKKSIKPPVPTSSSLAAANPFSEPIASQHSSAAPAPPSSYPSLSRTPQQQYPPRPLHDQYRPGFPQRPGTHTNQYPYNNSPVPHARLPSGPNHPGVMTPHPGQSASPRTVPGYPPTTPLSSRPALRSAQYPAQGGSFGSGPYPGMKRSSTDPYGPPNKYPRPNGQPSYPPNHHYRPETEPMMRQRYPSSGGPSSHSASPNLTTQASTSQGRPHPSYPHGFTSSSRRGGPIPSLYSRHDSALKPTVRWSHQSMQRAQSPAPMTQITKFQQDMGKRPLQMPLRAQYGTFKRDMSIFPPDSVEATLPRIMKFQRKTCRDVGPTEAWRLVMALKSGLLAESTWALNALTIFLYDQQSVGQLKLNQLPGLLDALVEHYRRCLSELFTLPEERESLGVAPNDGPADQDVDASDNGLLSLATVKPETRGKKKKGCTVLSKLSSKFLTMPLKVEPRSDPFLLDNTDRWDSAESMNLSDDLSHIVLSFSQQPIMDGEMPSEEVSSKSTDCRMVVEATLEDVLSIPCSVLSPDEYGFAKNPTEDFDVKMEKRDNKHDVKTPGDRPSKTSTKDDAIEEHLEVEKEESDVQKIAKTEESTSCVNAKPVPTVCVDKENEKPTEHSDKVASVDATEDSKKNATTEKDFKTNSCNLNGNVESPAESKEMIDYKPSQKTSDTVKTKDLPTICNGLQVNFHVKTKAESVSSQETSDFKQEKRNVSVKTETLHESEKNDSSSPNHNNDASDETAEVDRKSTEDGVSLSAKVKKILEERNVILLEDEAAGSDGSLIDALSGPLLSSNFALRRNELSNRLQCISNIIRGLSFVPHNMSDLTKQHPLIRALSGILLLRHKHRTRKRRPPTSIDNLNNEDEATASSEHENIIKVENSQSVCTSPVSIVAIKSEKLNCIRNSAKNKASTKKTISSELFAPKDEKIDTKQSKAFFSTTVLDESETNHIYSDPWWWDMVRRIREDALVILANISPTVDLSLYSDDHVPLAVLEACLHWCTCSSSDACDSFYLKSRYNVSAQKLTLEILAKLSIKDQNVDLILAMRPFSRVEKLLANLVALICDRRDQILREFAIVLLSNLSAGDSTAARAIALQNGSISGLITFLEECEETGLSNSKLFRQQSINCGTSPFMMSKAAKTLLSVAVIPENKPSFAKHQLRLLSLSMSQLLGSRVTSVISSLLYELSHDAST